MLYEMNQDHSSWVMCRRLPSKPAVRQQAESLEPFLVINSLEKSLQAIYCLSGDEGGFKWDSLNVSFALSVPGWCTLSCRLNLPTRLFLLSLIPISLKMCGQLAICHHLWSFYLKLGVLNTGKCSCIALFHPLLSLVAFLRFGSHLDPPDTYYWNPANEMCVLYPNYWKPLLFIFNTLFPCLALPHGAVVITEFCFVHKAAIHNIFA